MFNIEMLFLGLIKPRARRVGDSGPVIIPYKVINRLFNTLYGKITVPLSAYYSRERYKPLKDLFRVLFSVFQFLSNKP